MARRRFSSLACALALGMTVLGTSVGPITELHISDSHISLDGYRRPAVVASGTFPGPILKGNKGDQFVVTVVNHLTDPEMLTDTTIHWHGIEQKGFNWADGPAFVTQCPITTGDSFQYNFTVAHQAGTFWYHSHLATQSCDGLRGPFIVYDPHDPHKQLYDVDNDYTVITLAEWYHTLSRHQPIGTPPIPDATVINGLGRYKGGPASDLSVIHVEYGKRYRMRLIAMSCDPTFMFSIDNHDMTIIEVEGTNVKPHTINQIQILPGQRYSFVLNAKQPIDNYWIRATPNLGNSGFEGGINSAILRYRGARKAEPKSTQQRRWNLLRESDLRPLNPVPAPGKPRRGGADVSHYLAMSVDVEALFYINNATFTPPNVPVLLQMLSGARPAQDLLPHGSVIPLPRDAAVEVTLPGGLVAGPHPFHMHGHTFAVVRSAGSNTSNYDNPLWRDTVNIGGEGESVTIRFQTDNPGPWLFHCHIDWHLDLGLAVVFAEDIRGTIQSTRPSEEWTTLCPKYNNVHNGKPLERLKHAIVKLPDSP
ncbi:laccase 2 [Cristinia sonorae]|uniref:Laccase 2 n=1 Tax=Cristinia sonorae TaxID=1940300 RepID=A0A8K0UIY8_9AGAR|nr:laccase 2 [Cristinia sonorae]